MAPATAHRSALAALAALALSGCFDPSYPVGLACAEDGWCPPGQICNLARFCVTGSADAGVDALAFDAGPPDADGLGVLLSISIGEDVALSIGGTHQFTVIAHYELADVPVTEGIIWRSSATSVAGVDYTGLATAVGAGVTEITGRWSGRIDAALITVSP